jgi:hypothetical protein
MQNTALLERWLTTQKNTKKFIKIPTGDSKPEVRLVFSRENFSPAFLQKDSPNHDFRIN